MRDVKNLNEYSLLLAELANDKRIRKEYEKFGKDFVLDFDSNYCFVLDESGVVLAKCKFKDNELTELEVSDGVSELDIRCRVREGRAIVKTVVRIKVTIPNTNCEDILWDIPTDYIKRFPMLATTNLRVFGVEIFD